MTSKKKKQNKQTRLSRIRHLTKDPNFNISDWAKENGYTYAAVFNVLNGRTKNKRGEAREIALELGILDENDQSAIFEVNGEPIDISAWAKEHGYPYSAVHGVVTGRAKNKRGRIREIAEQLGLLEDKENKKHLPDNLAEWAKDHDFPYYVVYTVAKGNSKLTTPVAKKVAKELEKWQRLNQKENK